MLGELPLFRRNFAVIFSVNECAVGAEGAADCDRRWNVWWQICGRNGLPFALQVPFPVA